VAQNAIGTETALRVDPTELALWGRPACLLVAFLVEKAAVIKCSFQR
jgi:hypothetical protein